MSDCCLLTNIDLNSERICYLLERRFKSNSNRTSFDFKSLSAEQPSNNIKVSRSLLRCQPNITNISDYEENMSSDSSSSSSEEEEDNDDDDEYVSSTNDDDYLNKLAEWEPSNFQPIIETDDDDDDEDEDNEENLVLQPVNTEDDDETPELMEHSPARNTSSTPVEDLLVTFIHRPVKNEPINYDDNIYNNPPQLDGHMDSSSRSDANETQKRLDAAIAKISAKQSQPHKAIQIHQIPLQPTKFRLTNEIKKKPTNSTPKKPTLVPAQINRIKERTNNVKKTQPRLLSSLLRTNEDVIRPLQTRVSTTSTTNNQKPLRMSSDSHKPQDQRNSLVKNKQISMQPEKNTPLPLISKQRSLPQKLKSSQEVKEKSASDHMTLAQKKLNHLHKNQLSNISNQNPPPIKSNSRENNKIPSKSSNSVDLPAQKVQKIPNIPLSDNHKERKKKKVKKMKRLTTDSLTNQPRITDTFSSKTNQQKPIQHSVTKYNQGTIHQLESSMQSINSNNTKTSQRPADFFKDCIVIIDDDDDDDDQRNINTNDNQVTTDDDDIQEIERQHYSIAYNIRTREKLLDHVVHSREISFIQFGLTSHLRYLLIDLPTYKHSEEKDFNENCSKCHRYSLIINILFDLLFDLIEYDLCEKNCKIKYRSSLIEDDYFTRFLQSNSNNESTSSYDRIKFIIYFIELIGLHMNKCQNRKQFQFNQNENTIFSSIEDIIRHIYFHIKTSINQRISICLSVMELCLFFVQEKEIRMKQMAVFLAELCQNNLTYLNLILFDEKFLVDIRLLVINEIIFKKFSTKLCSIDHVKQFLYQIQGSLSSDNSIDEFVLSLLRSLFNTYADLIIDIKSFPFMYSSTMDELKFIFRNHLEITFRKLYEISDKSLEYFQRLKKPFIFFRLLKCKWNKL